MMTPNLKQALQAFATQYTVKIQLLEIAGEQISPSPVFIPEGEPFASSIKKEEKETVPARIRKSLLGSKKK